MFSNIWNTVVGWFQALLSFFHDLFEPVFGANSWGWAIIALTLLVRIFILPLAVKQFRSMRAMQALQPQLKALQKKYKVDRELMRKDPEQYRAKRQKLNEEMAALYKREGANPAASCLPLLAQAPIFIALFWTIRGMDELNGAPFYFFTNFTSPDAEAEGLAALVSQTGWPGWLLILLMSGTMFLTQKQMMARNPVAQATSDDGPNIMAQQQKILLYVMPVFLAVISFQFPLGLLLYWCTTNLWQVAQQAIILREVKQEAESGELENKPGGESLKRFNKRRRKGASAEGDAASAPEPRKRSPGASSGTKPVAKDPGRSDAPDRSTNAEPSKDKGAADTPAGRSEGSKGKDRGGANGAPSSAPPGSNGAKGAGPDSAGGTRKREHLPRRGNTGGS